MKSRCSCLSVAAVLLGSAGAPAQALFDRVGAVLADRFVDRAFCAEALPALLARHRPAAAAATAAAEERAVVHAMLAEIPASHTALLSAATRDRLEAELAGRRSPTIGCGLLQHAGRFHVDAVLPGSPAAAAGLRAGEPVTAVDGVPPAASPRLDWRNDDAWLPDPATHDLLVGAGETVALELGGDEPRTVRLRAAPWSALAADVAAVRALPLGGARALYVSMHFVYHGGASRLLRAALGEHAGCRGLVLDLRGRGGSALECERVLRALQAAKAGGVAVVALIDARTRSAKEILAFEIRRRDLGLLVGERTAGALLPATFVDVGPDAVLMLPAAHLGVLSRLIEGRGVEPDAAAAAPLPPEPGRDPILLAGLRVLEGILEASTPGESR